MHTESSSTSSSSSATSSPSSIFAVALSPSRCKLSKFVILFAFIVSLSLVWIVTSSFSSNSVVGGPPSSWSSLFASDPFANMVSANPQDSHHLRENPVAYRFGLSSSPALPAPRFVLISLIDDKNLGTFQANVASKMCYCQMTRECMSVIYNERDLRGWTPDGIEQRYLRLTWSRIFLFHRTMQTFNLTEDNWIIWFDADIVVTQPSITLDEIVRNASMRIDFHDRDDDDREKRLSWKGKKRRTHEPSMLVCDQNNGINAGLVGLRMTSWGRRFLQRWWRDRDAMRVMMDNGALIHAILREMAEEAGTQYRGECAQFLPHLNTPQHLALRNEDSRSSEHNLCDKSVGCSTWEAFSSCHQRYLFNVLCKGRPESCANRVPHSDKPWDSAWKPGMTLGRDYEYGFMLRYHSQIVTHSKINPGIGFGKCAEFDANTSWILHLAGGPGKKPQLMTEWMLKTADRFSPRCY